MGKLTPEAEAKFKKTDIYKKAQKAGDEADKKGGPVNSTHGYSNASKRQSTSDGYMTKGKQNFVQGGKSATAQAYKEMKEREAK